MEKDGIDVRKVLFSIFKIDLEGEIISLRDAFWSFSSEKVKILSSSHPKKNKVEIELRFFCES